LDINVVIVQKFSALLRLSFLKPKILLELFSAAVLDEVNLPFFLGGQIRLQKIYSILLYILDTPVQR